MPSETFTKLPADKRERFLSAALDEFAAHPYQEASISRIVARLQIAKGSVYQYFDDKADLFCWLVEEGGRRKVQLVHTVDTADVWERLRGMYRAGLSVWQHDPRWARIGLRAMEATAEPKLEALRRRYEDASEAFLAGLLREAQRSGQVRADLEIGRAVHFVKGVLTTGLLSAFFRELGADLDAWVTAPHPLPEESRQRLLTVADDAVDFVRRALGPAEVKPR